MGGGLEGRGGGDDMQGRVATCCRRTEEGKGNGGGLPPREMKDLERAAGAE